MNNNLVVNVPVEYVVPNPWQPRASEDAEHIKGLALSIAEEGLMQMPVGRLLDAYGNPVGIDVAMDHAGVFDTVSDLWAYILETMGCRVQLAFGHSRLAAFKWLVDLRDHSDLKGDWSLMPVRVMDLGDEEMYKWAIQENVRRKDLTAIEEATAMARYRDEFGKNSAQIGEVFGVSESTVRGKMRLLNLPAEVQAASRDLSEGTMRELLFLFDLPEEVREGMKGASWQEWTSPGKIVETALKGAPTGEISRTIDAAISGSCENMGEQLWKMDEVLVGDGIRGVCEGCPMRFKRSNTYWCGDKSCFYAKRNAWKAQYLAQASLLSGISADFETTAESASVENFTWESGRAILDLARASGCPNLRLVFARSDPADYAKHTRVEGFPRAEIVCSKGAFCTCKKAATIHAKEAREEVVEWHKREEHEAKRVDELRAESPRMDDLQEIVREERRRKRDDLDAARRFAERGRDRIFTALAEQNAVVWRELMIKLDYKAEEKIPVEAGIGAAWLELANWLAKRIYDPNGYDPSAERCWRAFDALFERAGVERLMEEPTLTPSPSPLQGEGSGKSLVEVFEEAGEEGLDSVLQERL